VWSVLVQHVLDNISSTTFYNCSTKRRRQAQNVPFKTSDYDHKYQSSLVQLSTESCCFNKFYKLWIILKVKNTEKINILKLESGVFVYLYCILSRQNLEGGGEV